MFFILSAGFDLTPYDVTSQCKELSLIFLTRQVLQQILAAFVYRGFVVVVFEFQEGRRGGWDRESEVGSAFTAESQMWSLNS